MKKTKNEFTKIWNEPGKCPDLLINNKYISGYPGSPWHPKDDFLNMEVSTARSDCQFPELPKIAPDGYRFAEPNNFLNYVRVHDMFSRILTFLFVIAFSRKRISFR